AQRGGTGPPVLHFVRIGHHSLPRGTVESGLAARCLVRPCRSAGTNRASICGGNGGTSAAVLSFVSPADILARHSLRRAASHGRTFSPCSRSCCRDRCRWGDGVLKFLMVCARGSSKGLRSIVRLRSDQKCQAELLLEAGNKEQ